MNKKIRVYNGKNLYFLGVDKDGDNVYLQDISFDCGWYWGMGYVESFRPRAKSQNSHMHFDSLFLTKDLHKSFKNYFDETVLNDREMWQLLEYMKSLYQLRKFAEMIHLHGSHITQNDFLKENFVSIDTEYRDRINTVLIPGLWSKVVELLTV